MKCDQEHSLCVHLSDSPLPTRIIDVRSNPPFLRDAHGEKARYTCLSYCWDKLQPLTTTVNTLRSRQEGIHWHSLPQTFKDAIKVTRNLRIPYIWIDSLCIVQDSAEDWAVESANMRAVYGNSYLTIAATSSADSHGGLFRRTVAPIRCATQMDGGCIAVFIREPLDHSSYQNYLRAHTQTTAIPLFTRSWVVQDIICPLG